MLTCPVAAFMGADAEAKAGKAGTTARGRTPAGGIKPSINSAIPPLCLKSVEKFTKLYPTLSVMDMVKKGGSSLGRYRVQIGGKGDCSNFNLLGKCTDPTCTYNHKSAKIGEDRQTLAGNVGVVLGFPPPKTTDMPTCRRHVADTTQTMSATLYRVGLPDVGCGDVVSACVNCDVCAPCCPPWAPSTTPSPAAHASPAPDPPIWAS
jgi:hypothetical protein